MIKGIRNWLIVFLGGLLRPQGGARTSSLVEDVPFRKSLSTVVLDEAMYECACTQWHFGDWKKLVELKREAFQNHPQRSKLALLAAAGRLQTGANAEAGEYIALAKEWGCTDILISRVLISSVHNSLGRSASVMGDQARALEHYEASVAIATPGNDTRLLTQARVVEQVTQLGLEAVQQRMEKPLEMLVR